MVLVASGFQRLGPVPAHRVRGQGDDGQRVRSLAQGAGHAENVTVGEVVVEKTTGSYLRSEGPLVATIGVEDLIVIATPDAVLVAHKGHDQDVKLIVERLRALNHDTVAPA